MGCADRLPKGTDPLQWAVPIAYVCLGVLLVLGVFVDTFETVILPRSVSRPFNLTRVFLSVMWRTWRGLSRALKPGNSRETFLSTFGPMALVLLVSVWAALLIVGFGLMQWGLGAPIHAPEPDPTLASYLYMSATTFFTLGYGDITPLNATGRTVSVVEAGVGFGFLALVIGYLPVLYQAFSRREGSILRLDARAGSPPVAGELLARHFGDVTAIGGLLRDFEGWAAELLEAYLSYPILAFYRSQHDRQSWLAALSAILDSCAAVSLGFKSPQDTHPRLMRQARLTFAVARHVVIDLAYILDAPPHREIDRLSPEDWDAFILRVHRSGLDLEDGPEAYAQLKELRACYEPYLGGLAQLLALPLTRWVAEPDKRDQWETSAWDGAHF